MTDPRKSLKPFLDVIIVSSQMHVYISQTDRGEFLIGAVIEPYTTHKGTSTFPFLEYSARQTLTPRLIEPFALERFYTDTMVSELARGGGLALAISPEKCSWQSETAQRGK